MRTTTNPRILWPTLVFVSGIPRIACAFGLPNAFGDAYVYIRDIGTLSTKLSAGTFKLTDLYGFWLPLYQLISAAINVFVRNGFYTGKIVSAIFGVGACLLIYAITLCLTHNRTTSLLAFLLIAFNPLHIFYSASAMTDVPHSFLVLASLYFVLRRGWVVAAVFAALAGLTRVESWMFLILLPAIQFVRDRYISIPGVVILLMPPLLWFYLSWKATGNWLACFESRQQYLSWLLTMNPELARFSFSSVFRDIATLVVSTDAVVLVASFGAGWLVTKYLARMLTARKIPEDVHKILPPVVFFFAFFALLIVAYLTHQQPIIFPRYGLILFSLGIPLLAWMFLRLKQDHHELAKRVLIAAILVCLFEASIELVGAVGSLNQISAERAVADYLRTHFQPNANARIFSDEGTVVVMSGIPAENFLSSANAPRDRGHLLEYLREQNVEYVVFTDKPDSIPANVLPELQNGGANETFEAVMHASSRFVRTNIWLYRLRKAEL